MFSWYYLCLSEKNEIGNVRLEVRACSNGSCREVGHTVLLSGEAISLRIFLPLSEKYHRRNFRFYTVFFCFHKIRGSSQTRSPLEKGAAKGRDRLPRRGKTPRNGKRISGRYTIRDTGKPLAQWAYQPLR